MTKDPLTLYKLIVLYMLSRVDFPLTKTQIVDFVLEKEYTGYLNLQSAISQLRDGNMIAEKTIRNRTQLFITEEGHSTLAYFGNRISPQIKADIDEYLKNHTGNLKEEVMITSDYSKLASGGYEAHLSVKENNLPLLSLNLSVPTEELASSVCKNWETKNQDVYQKIIEQLFQ